MTAQLVHAGAALSVRTLSHSRLAQAFPLAAACDPALTLTGWLTTAMPRARPDLPQQPCPGYHFTGTGAPERARPRMIEPKDDLPDNPARENRSAPSRGVVLSAETPDGHIRGLCVVAINTDAELGRHLAMERVATPALGRATIAGALHAEALALASAWRCPSMALTQTRAPDWLVQFLLATGYRPVRQRYVRILTGATATDPTPH